MVDFTAKVLNKFWVNLVVYKVQPHLKKRGKFMTEECNNKTELEDTKNEKEEGLN